LSDQAELLGTPFPFTFDGKDYLVSERTFEQEGLFKIFLEAEALRVIQRHAANLNPMEFMIQMTGWRQDCSTFQYAVGTQNYLMGEYSPDGMRYLAYLALKEKSAGLVTPALVDRIFKDEKKWKELQAILSRLNDPNSKRPGDQNLPANP